MRKQGKEEFKIVVDTRKKTPFKYENAVVKTLKTGDYSILGHENKITIERKRPEELFLCVGRDRKRFIREIERLSKYEYAAIVIEGDLKTLLKPSRYSQVSPKSVLNSLISWSVQYGVHVFFASDRKHAWALVYRILQKYYKHRRDDVNK